MSRWMKHRSDTLNPATERQRSAICGWRISRGGMLCLNGTPLEKPSTYFIRTVLRMLNDAEGLFTTDADKEEFLQTIKKRGKIRYHHGWDTMCREVEAKKRKADPRFRRV